jgi:hypothetical protein
MMRILYTAVESSEGLPFAQILEIYDPDTGTMSSFTLSRSAPMGDGGGDTVLEYFWAQEGGQPRIVLFQRQAGWRTLDPNTGTLAPLTAVPFRTVHRGIGVIRLTPLFQEQPDGSHRWQWQAEVLYDGGQPGYTASIGYNASSLGEHALPVLSGSYDIAWMSYENPTATIYLWQDGAARNPQAIFSANPTAGWGIGPMGVAWHPMQWYIDRTSGTPNTPPPTQTPRPPGQCPPPHPTGFEAGELVTVSPGPPNNWREQPSTRARVLGVLPAGTILTILDGPVCADGFNWYYVQFTEGRGWTAGGDGSEYWLQPAG